MRRPTAILLASRVRRGFRCSCWEPRPGGLIFSSDPTVADPGSVAISYTAREPCGATIFQRYTRAAFTCDEHAGPDRLDDATGWPISVTAPTTDGLGRGSSTKSATQELVQLRVGLGVELQWFASFAQLLE